MNSGNENYTRNHFFLSETRGRITGTDRRISANNKHASLERAAALLVLANPFRFVIGGDGRLEGD